MAQWREQFEIQCRIRRGIIVHGNVSDSFFDPVDLSGVPIVKRLEQILSGLKDNSGTGFQIVHWNPVQGALPVGDIALRELQADARRTVEQPETKHPANVYDFGNVASLADGGADDDLQAATRKPEDFFRLLLTRLARHPESASNHATAYIIDGADSLFGNANSLSQAERQYLLLVGNALRDAECSMDSSRLGAHEDIVILVASRLTAIPARFYQDNPAITDVYLPLPDRKEREEFLQNATDLFHTQDALSDSRKFEEVVDSLDGFTFRHMQQLVRLSRIGDPVPFKKLVNQFRYGKSISPWEDLNHDRLMKLNEELTASVKGQDHVVERVGKVIRKAYAGLSGLQHSDRQQMPKGILFFVGPTGVGKTEMAKAIARFLFVDEDSCIRFDMSEYNHEHSDQRLIGAPPGYTGYEEGGQLTNAVKRRPFSVILFDEIEKAHGKILDKFLQILEDGRLTDGKGDTVSFGESVIVFTSNIGASDVNPNDENISRLFIEKVKEHFVTKLGRPELLNRIGEQNILPFNFLTDKAVLMAILCAKLKPLETKLLEKYGLKLTFDDQDRVLSSLIDDYDPRNGGRGIASRLDERIFEPLAEELFEQNDDLNGRAVVVSRPDQEIRIRIR